VVAWRLTDRASLGPRCCPPGTDGNRLERHDGPRCGPVAPGTSARSATLTDWPAGGFVGIHGTDGPELLPDRVSHGSIRMRNDDVLRLAG
jgi:lipoprotein-anchoring transpeptidase ErfK/SrfK